jgi:hypothetical protein
MNERVPSVFILVPGPWSDSAAVADALTRRGIAASVRADSQLASGEVAVEVVADDGLAQAFSWGRRGPLPEDLVGAIGQCDRAALVEAAYRLDKESSVFARIGHALRAEGGLAVRMEGSGAASEWQPWIERLESADPASVYDSAVLIVRDDDSTYFTCGMHQFDLPDAQISLDEPEEAIEWLDTFNVYQLAENPLLGSGHTFCPHEGALPRTLERWPDHRHHPSDGRQNPFGVWRHLPAGAARIKPSELVPVIMPSLVAMLASSEKNAGRPLSKDEVTGMVSSSPCIAMERSHAIAMEKSRGYADIEPDLAWEQWQIVRQTL